MKPHRVVLAHGLVLICCFGLVYTTVYLAFRLQMPQKPQGYGSQSFYASMATYRQDQLHQMLMTYAPLVVAACVTTAVFGLMVGLKVNRDYKSRLGKNA